MSPPPKVYAVMNHAVWGEIAPELTPADFKNPERMDVGALRTFSRIRRRAGVPFRIVSDARSPDTNPGAKQSAHMELPCTAIDLRALNNAERWKIVKAAIDEGITRIGIYAPTEDQVKNFGKASGSVHIDTSIVNPAERIWMGW